MYQIINKRFVGFFFILALFITVSVEWLVSIRYFELKFLGQVLIELNNKPESHVLRKDVFIDLATNPDYLSEFEYSSVNLIIFR